MRSTIESFVRGATNRCCCEERVRPNEHCLFSMSARYRGAVRVPLMHRNFDATFVRKPMPLLETWRDVVMNVILAEPITEAFKKYSPALLMHYVTHTAIH